MKALQRVRYFHISLLKGLFSKYLFVVFSNISFFEGQSLGNPIVTDVQPRRIGYGGGAVTIHGQVKIFTSFKKIILFIQGFSEDVFSQFDPVLGNKVCINRICSLSKVLILEFRFGLPTSLSRWYARPRSAQTSCWRTRKTHRPQGSPATSLRGWAPRDPTGSTLSLR